LPSAGGGRRRVTLKREKERERFDEIRTNRKEGERTGE
jgi:hypothetical protein